LQGPHERRKGLVKGSVYKTLLAKPKLWNRITKTENRNYPEDDVKLHMPRHRKDARAVKGVVRSQQTFTGALTQGEGAVTKSEKGRAGRKS